MTTNLQDLIDRITTERAQEAAERAAEHRLTEQGHGYQVYDEMRTDHAENDQHRLDALLHALHATHATQTLPRHEDGTINTSAEFGPGPLLVEITYNTDPEGNWTDDDTNRTLHGPFTTFDEAITWINACRPDDTDIQDMLILHTNNVRPT